VHDRKKKRTKRVSIKTGGAEADDTSRDATISANGRFVAFSSRATNLVNNDTNDKEDVFVHDRRTKKTKRVSVRSNGGEGNGGSGSASISGNGRYVVFVSGATNLVKNDDNGVNDIFVHDRTTKKTKRVSVRSGGGEATGSSNEPSLSANGRFVAFASNAPNLVANDHNAKEDIFVHDRRKKRTRRMSIRTDGGEGSNSSFEPAITANGRYVYFATDTDDLVDSDTNGKTDVLRRDRLNKKTKVISKKNGGGQSPEHSEDPWVTPNGRWVVFESEAKLQGSDTSTDWDIYIRGPLR
jgi:Tol biopolymer transport system component